MILREHIFARDPSFDTSREQTVDTLGDVFDVPWIKEHGESSVIVFRHYVIAGQRVIAHLLNDDGTPHV